jgi:hypothetical protein
MLSQQFFVAAVPREAFWQRLMPFGSLALEILRAVSVLTFFSEPRC